jgi:hypothetical protein
VTRARAAHIVQGIGLGLMALALSQVIGWWALVAVLGYVIYREAGDFR